MLQGGTRRNLGVLDLSTHFFFFLFGDLVPGPWGSIPGPGEGVLRGFWTPQNNKKYTFLLGPKGRLRRVVVRVSLVPTNTPCPALGDFGVGFRRLRTLSLMVCSGFQWFVIVFNGF